MARLGDKLAPGTTQDEKSAAPASGVVSAEDESNKILCLDARDDTGFAVRFELLRGGVVLLPFHHLAKAELDATGEVLTAIFWTDELRICGRGLLKVVEALQDARKAVVRAVDAKYRPLYGENEVFIFSIEVKKRKEGDGDEEAGPDD